MTPKAFNYTSSDKIIGTLSAAGQSVAMAVGDGRSSLLIEVSGTFEGSLVVEGSRGGTTWTAINTRKAGVGRISLAISSTGAYRGNASGFNFIRVRAAAIASGSAAIDMGASNGVGAVLEGGLVDVRDLEQYYAADAGGNVLFNVTSGEVNLANTGVVVAALVNPVNSQVNCYIDLIELGATIAGRFRRFRNGTLTLPTPIDELNAGGGTNRSTSKFYAAGSLAASAGTVGKTIFVAASSSHTSQLMGTRILKPGQNFYWTFTPNSTATSTAAIDVSWWELAI